MNDPHRSGSAVLLGFLYAYVFSAPGLRIYQVPQFAKRAKTPASRYHERLLTGTNPCLPRFRLTPSCHSSAGVRVCLSIGGSIALDSLTHIASRFIPGGCEKRALTPEFCHPTSCLSCPRPSNVSPSAQGVFASWCGSVSQVPFDIQRRDCLQWPRHVFRLYPA